MIKNGLIILSCFLTMFQTAYGAKPERQIELIFDKAGNYSVKAVHDSRTAVADSAAAYTWQQPDKADAHLLFSECVDYSHVYGDSLRPKPNFEPVQVLEGTVEDTDGRQSIEVLALNCKSCGIFKTMADKNGRFSLNVMEFADSTVFNIDAIDKLDKRKKFNVALTEPAVPRIPAPAFVRRDDNTIGYLAYDSARVLKNIDVVGKRKDAMNIFKIDPSKAMYDGDPAIYRHPNIQSLLRSMGIYHDLHSPRATVLLDNQIIQRSTDTDEDYTLEPNIMDFLNTININEVWQVEWIERDPRTSMFHAFQTTGAKGNPVLLIFTKFGAGGSKYLGRPAANSFTPQGYELNIRNQAEENVGDLIMWRPEFVAKAGDKLRIDLSEADPESGVNISVAGISETGELVDCKFIIL